MLLDPLVTGTVIMLKTHNFLPNIRKIYEICIAKFNSINEIYINCRKRILCSVYKVEADVRQCKHIYGNLC